jgi:hypothetical protein
MTPPFAKSPACKGRRFGEVHYCVIPDGGQLNFRLPANELTAIE